MYRILLIVVTILCFNIEATDLTDKLTGCLEDNRNQINQSSETAALKAVSSCLTGFVQNLEQQSEAKTKVTNPVVSMPDLLGSYSWTYQGYSGFGYGIAEIGNGFSLTGFSMNKSALNSDLLQMPGFGLVGLGSEDDGALNNVYYGSGTCSDCDNASNIGGNIAFGFEALKADFVASSASNGHDTTTPVRNHAFGYQALYSNTDGAYNHAFGYQSMYNNTSGYYNSAFGARTLLANTTGDFNVVMGSRALSVNTTGSSNVAIGNNSINCFQTGDYNTAIGRSSLAGQGSSCGDGAGSTWSTGSYNTALGAESLNRTSSGANNVAVGYKALYTNSTGTNNTALGYEAGYSNITGASNVFIGYQAGYNETGSDKLYISNSSSQNLITGDFSTGYLSLGRTGLANGGIGIYGDLGAQFMDDDASHYVAFVAPTSVSSNVTWTLPGSDGTSGQVLSTSGTGTLSWSTVSSGSTNSTLALANGTLTLTDSSGGTVSVDISDIDTDTNTDTNTYVASSSLSGNVLTLTMSSGTEITQDLDSLTTGLSADTNTYLKSAALDGSNLVITMSDNSTTTVDLAGMNTTNTANVASNTTNISANSASLTANKTSIATNTADIANNQTSIATNTSDIASNKTSIATNTADIANNQTSIAANTATSALNTSDIAALGVSLDNFKQSTADTFTYMRSDYSSGIASAIAIGQISIADEGFSVGVGYGRFNGRGEQAIGFGYGGELKNGTNFKVQATKNNFASGVGFTMTF